MGGGEGRGNGEGRGKVCATQAVRLTSSTYKRRERIFHLVALGLRQGCGDVEHLPHSWRKGGRCGPARPRLSRSVKPFSDGICIRPHFFKCFDGGFGTRRVHHDEEEAGENFVTAGQQAAAGVFTCGRTSYATAAADDAGGVVRY